MGMVGVSPARCYGSAKTHCDRVNAGFGAYQLASSSVLAKFRRVDYLTRWLLELWSSVAADERL